MLGYTIMEMTKNEQFIAKARGVHGNRYDYSKVNYISAKGKITITCENHGDFEQTPSNHLSGFNCQQCAKNSKMNTNSFIERAAIIHENKYDYSKVNYVNADIKITIICKEHGDFEQIPDFHLNRKSGCPKCANNVTLTNNEFTEKANIKHKNKYDYSQISYINNRTKVDIICKEHGVFQQTPTRHLGGEGCPSCVNKTDYKFFTYLNSRYPSVQRQFKADWCKQKRCLPYDYVVEEYKKIIELDGPHHSETQNQQNLFKTKCANENGYSVIRILHADVSNELIDFDYLTKCIETNELKNIHL